ncbi:hypothetical protein Pfo_014062 [Paulownia fortunei]|nr:hypothetical protein Pfo_014062 [Paulownia fortunei]
MLSKVTVQYRVGKEERVAMEMAIEDLNRRQNEKLILRVKCSRGEPLQAAQAAGYLINKNHVQAILGPNSWEESSAVAEVGHQFDVPILSLSDSTPPWATRHWPFFIQASPSTSNQMKSVSAIIESWKWRRVNVIYEDTDSASTDILNHLYGAFQDVDVQMSGLVSLPSFASFDTLHEELEKLKSGQCRVFVVHASLALAERVFRKAKEMKMMEREYVWITMDSTTSLVHSMNASVISSMQGVLGVRRYFPDTGEEFHNFCVKFLGSFHKKYPEEKNHDPGMFALQAYDATWAVGSAISAGSKNGQQILEKIEETDFNGLSGKIQFKDRKLAPINQFQIINVIGKSYQELGFWSDGLGFSTVIDNTAEYSFSMEILGRVFWPGGPWSTPRGWDLPTISNPLIIGVPNGSITNKFVKVEYDPITNNYNFSGFSIEVFNRTVRHLNYSLPYHFIPFPGTYTDLVKQVQLKEFDAAVGDIAIISSRYDHVEFTHAHTESGLVMVVPIQKYSNRAWLFMKPFTKAMWLLTAFVNIYNGFVIWSIERNYCAELKGSLLNQIGALLWLAFTTLFSLHGGERLHSNLSKMATIVWLFVALIITQSYTASLTSMLTVQRMEPKIANIETLKSENAFIGYSKMSFVKGYLEEALHFNPNNIKNFTTPETYAEALRSGEISAAFLEVPDAKLFVAKYCKSFTIAGPTYKVGGYGFAFPKGSPLLPDIDKALLNVFEVGELKDLENSLIASEKCVDIQVDNETASLSPHSFFVLFIFTGGTSTAALAIYYFRSKMRVDNSMAEHRATWMLILMVLKKWRNQRNRMSRKVSDVESPSPTSSST